MAFSETNSQESWCIKGVIKFENFNLMFVSVWDGFDGIVS